MSKKVLSVDNKLLIVENSLILGPNVDLQDKSIVPASESQVITPDTEYYGLSSVTVEGDVNLIPENIAKDAVIFGITGTHQGGEDVSAELTEQDDIIALMQEAITTKSAAGVAEPFAVIGVTYPEGSTCTCTDGVEEFTAKDTSGQAIFVIPYVGTWTVSCTDGTNTKSQTMSITSEGQSESVELMYLTYYLQGGNNNANFVETCDENGALSINTNGLVFTTKTNGGTSTACTSGKIDLSKINTLYVALKDVDIGTGIYLVLDGSVRVTDWTTLVQTSVAVRATATKNVATQIMQVDVSQINEAMYISVGTVVANGTAYEIYGK